jgi:hypothetical protein
MELGGSVPVGAAVRRPTLLEAVRTWYGMPVAAAQLLEADREGLKMRRFEYLQHLVFQRSLELREKGPGVDAPGGNEKKKR